MSDEQSTTCGADTWDGVVTDRFAAHIASCEDADPAGADEETDDDENDAEQNLPSKRGDDAGDDQDHGEDPQQSGHETSRGSAIAEVANHDSH